MIEYKIEFVVVYLPANPKLSELLQQPLQFLSPIHNNAICRDKIRKLCEISVFSPYISTDYHPTSRNRHKNRR